jgi:cephalosporin hydroxylase
MMFLDRSKFQYTNGWFEGIPMQYWDFLLPQFNPRRILEIGSYEGQATCYLMEKLNEMNPLEPAEIHCVDPWLNYDELHTSDDMAGVEMRYDHNIATMKSLIGQNIHIIKHKAISNIVLPILLAEGRKNYFDFVYVDGSHQAPDVLFDALMAYELVRPGGYIAFDDYLWSENPIETREEVRCPKMAVDAFTANYGRKVHIVHAPLYQLYVQKVY